MALTSLDKDTTNRLLNMLSLNENEKNTNLEIIKQNYSSYSKLEIIAKQINILQIEAESIINDARLNDKLLKIPMTCKKIPGKIYYHYIINDKEILSIIGPDEWTMYTEYLGKYLYNYDNLFYSQH